MPRTSKRSNQHQQEDSSRRQSAREEGAISSYTMASRRLRSGSAGILESLPTASSSSSIQQQPRASNVNAAALTTHHNAASSTSKRQRSHNTQEQSRSKKQKSWEDCSTEEDELSPAEEAQHGIRSNSISTVTPSSAMLVSRVTSAVDPNTTGQVLALELESPNTTQHNRLMNHQQQQSLPPGVVDLYSSSTRRSFCMCGEDHCSSESLTASFLSTYGQEYYDYLRQLDGGGGRLLQRMMNTMQEDEDRDDTSSEGSRSTTLESPPSPDNYHRESPPPIILGSPYEDDDLGALEGRNDITSKMRGVLIDWLIEISEAFSLTPSTLQLAVALVDKSLGSDKFHIRREMVQCLGCACMWIAVKMEEVNILTVQDFVYISDNSYPADTIADMELQVCGALGYRLSIVTPYHYLYEFLRASYACSNLSSCCCSSSRSYKLLDCMTRYLLELSLLPYEFQQLSPKMIAAACIYLARATLGRRGSPEEAANGSPEAIWTKTLQYYTGFSVMELEETVRLLHRYQRAASESLLKSVFVKYSHEKYMMVSLKTALPSSDLGL